MYVYIVLLSQMSFKPPSFDLLGPSSSSSATTLSDIPLDAPESPAPVVDKRFQSIVTPAEEIEDETPFVWQQDQPEKPPKIISAKTPTSINDILPPFTLLFILLSIIAIVILIVYFFVGF
jgi:hypothetical protein